MDDAPLDFLPNAADTLILETSTGPLPADVPISEIEIETTTTPTIVPVPTKPPPTEPRALSANPVPVWEASNEPELIGPDIQSVSSVSCVAFAARTDTKILSNVNREKIVIGFRPRCKEYVEKQKQKPPTLRALACFSASVLKPNEEESAPESDVAMTDAGAVVAAKAPSTKALWLPEPRNSKKRTPTKPRALSFVNTKTPPIKPRAVAPLLPIKPRSTVSSGRIEKPARSSPRKVQASDPPFVVPIAPYELYSCGCSTPSDCQICTLRRLADKFCAIVTALLTKTTRGQCTLVFGAARDSVLRSREAKLDRYDVIRTFFNAQSTVTRKPIGWTLREETHGFAARTRHLHSSRRAADANPKPPPNANEHDVTTKSSAKPEPMPPPPPIPNYDNYSPFFRRLAMSLPHLPRPSRDDFLKVATGFWARARIRFKWFTIKSFRPFNADDMSAFITWFVMSQTLWIFVGTTTFFSVVFATANSLSLQQYIARGISDYLTAETGVTVIFESAIVPKWKDSRISFKNVFISRRPQSAPPPTRKTDREGFAAGGYDISGHPAYHRVGEDEDETTPASGAVDEDTNYTMFDLNVDSIDVTLSLWRWLDGKGLIQDAVIKGVRGILDRRSVYWDPDNPLDPASFRHTARPGDFELESLQLEDVLVTVYQPDGFRPYTASIFQADIKTFRKQWIFYDFLCAENIVGQFDNCLFSLHKPQSIGRTTEMDLKDGDWGRMSRIRIDGVPIDHIQRGTTTDGPISWITSGKVDAVLDIKFPRDPTDASQLKAVLGEIADAIFDPIMERIPAQRGLAKPPLQAPPVATVEGDRKEDDAPDDPPRLVIDIDLRFRDLKAAVPLFTNDLSYVNYALVRPIVSFMNANRTLVPIRCRVVKDVADFDGSWTMWESGLMDEVSLQVYDAMAYHVTQANMNRRLKTVSLWSLQMTAGAVVSTLRTMVDPVSARMREAYLNGRGLYEDSFQPGPMVDF
ncbi:hypothetical protein MVEN_00823300 [Mycena venus]|uniref:Mitochondrial distribution and morphology protein family 31/32 n=1 Tax=Mycena venus TaxID=2733690 RepID=A0A8H6YDL5_9AGAR|nr:hypothetical protein MVEN_00823300 [Mycena venus]